MFNYPINRFDIDDKAAKLINLDLIDMLKELNKELDALEKMRIPKDVNDKYAAKDYLKFLTDLQLILSGGIVTNMDSYLSSQIKPIVQKLVDKKQLLSGIMESFSD